MNLPTSADRQANAVPAHLDVVLDNFRNNLSQLAQSCRSFYVPLHKRLERFLDNLGTETIASQIPHATHKLAHAFASISSSSKDSLSRRPLYEVSMAKDEVKARLAPISVYTVTNPDQEFVLVSGENNTQLGFLFFRKEDAEAVIDKVKQEDPRLARESKVLPISMDNVYDILTTPRDQTGLQEIHFRFFPDLRQVKHALQLYKDAGVSMTHFTGVPVFQAEGLTVTTQQQTYVPLFLCKEDLDIAVDDAYKVRNAAQIKVYRERANKVEDEYQNILQQVEKGDERQKKNLQGKADKVKQKLDQAMEKLSSVEKAPLPKIEVGSFEEVMMRMTASTGKDLEEWSQIMFVAPGLLQNNRQAAKK